MGHLLTGFPAGTEGTGPLARPGVLALGRFQLCVCVSTMTCDVIQRVASIRGPTRHHRGRVSASWNVPATKATAPSVIVRS